MPKPGEQESLLDRHRLPSIDTPMSQKLHDGDPRAAAYDGGQGNADVIRDAGQKCPTGHCVGSVILSFAQKNPGRQGDCFGLSKPLQKNPGEPEQV